MGFKANRDIRLAFDDPEMEGAEVVCRSIPVSMYFQIAGLDSTNIGIEETRKLLTDFAEHVLKEWNLEDDEGNEIPATIDGLFNLDVRMALTIVRAWIDGVVTLPVPLEPQSSNGSISEMPSISQRN